MAYQFVGKGHAGSTYEDAGSNPGIRRDINFAENDLSPQSRARLHVLREAIESFLSENPPLMKQSNH